MVRKLFPLGFVTIFNLWLWKILDFNLLMGILVIITSIFLWLSFSVGKKYFFYIALGLFILLIFAQWQTSYKTPITYLNENEKLIQQTRLRAYPPLFYKIPVANWLEQRKEAIFFYKLEENFSEAIDPNLYFFANHPRERIGVVEFEKFPYILLPVFILGLFSLQKKDGNNILLGLSPLVLISIVGNSNPAGPFALFPFFAVTISRGLEHLLAKKKLLIYGLAAFVLVFIQIFAYATS